MKSQLTHEERRLKFYEWFDKQPRLYRNFANEYGSTALLQWIKSGRLPPLPMYETELREALGYRDTGPVVCNAYKRETS